MIDQPRSRLDQLEAEECGICGFAAGHAAALAGLPVEALNRIIEKTEQYWNESNICDAEVHAALEFINRQAREVLSWRKGAKE